MRNKERYILFATVIMLAIKVNGQNTKLITNGTVLYRKEVNVFALVKKKYSDKNDFITTKLIDDYKANYPNPIKTINYSLSFSRNNSYYVRTSSVTTEENGSVGQVIGFNSTTYTNFQTDSTTSQKNILGNLYEIYDRSSQIIWKITDETREIAGFQCRRANGLIMDSVYVVAFFCTQIPVPVGPGSIHGLPGMILGLAIPDLHTSIFAYSVLPQQDSKDSVKQIELKTKGITISDFINSINGNLTNWQLQQAIFL